MWKKVGEKEGELKNKFLDEMLANGGCRTERFGNTYESAWHITGGLAASCSFFR